MEAGLTPYIPKPKTSASRKRGLFAKDDFRYDQEQDCYWCPAGEKLSYRFPWTVRQDRQTTEKGRDIKYYASSACVHCTSKTQCTRSKDGRRITRCVDEDLPDEMERRAQGNLEKMKLRKKLAEHRSSSSTGSFWNDQAPLGSRPFPDPETSQRRGRDGPDDPEP